MLDEENFHLWWKRSGRQQLRQILHWRWDPLGVSDYCPDAEDEYDAYLPQLIALLRDGGTADDVARCLARVRRDSMGVGAHDPAGEAAAAELIASWYPASVARWPD